MIIKSATLFLLLASFYFLAFFNNDAFAEIYDRFVGWKACQECHTELGEGWTQTRHAHAFESLIKSGQQDLPDCLKCHVVGYDQSGGFLDPDLTMELAGVQCESCHGPGKKHLDQPEESESIVRTPAKELCRTCHTTGQDPDFDYNKKAASLHGEESSPSLPPSASHKMTSSNSKLFVDQTLIEPSSVDEGVPVIVNVFLKNIGANDILITDLVSSWACTEGLLGKHLLKPQEDTFLRIIYQTKDRPGPYEKRIYLSTDIPDQDDIVITIKGTVIEAPVAKIRVEPKKIRLGLIKTGLSTNFNIHISNEGSEPLVITKVQNMETMNNYLDARKQEKLVIGPKGSTIYNLAFQTNKVGPFVQVIFIESNARNAFNGRSAFMVIGEAEPNQGGKEKGLLSE